MHNLLFHVINYCASCFDIQSTFGVPTIMRGQPFRSDTAVLADYALTPTKLQHW